MRGMRTRVLIPLAVAAVAVAAVAATSATARSSASTIKVAVLSDCQGAFGAFDNQDLAGVVAAMSQYAGAKPVDANNPRKGWTGGSIGGHPIKLVGIGCGNDRADTAIKETKRLMEQLGYLDEVARETGDDASRLVISYQVTLNIGDSEEAARGAFGDYINQYYPELSRMTRLDDWGPVGSPEQIIDWFRTFAEAGVDHFICRFGSLDQFGQVERFAHDVLPAFETAGTMAPGRVSV